MGMTIDEAVKKLKGQQADFNEQYIDFGGINDAFNTAYEVMRKYQKIKELYDYWRSGKCEYTISCMENIGKVLKDGKID